ncbi:MAG TPA: hypothetical protein VHD81_00455 [Mycobacteriales bacterium]|nr:hypothetical protein [Mycobacteriales bacterium]
MTFDEHALSDALHSIEAEASPDLASLARAGGRRRLLRRRSATAAGAVAVGAIAAPVGLAVRSGLGADNGTIKVGASPTATDPSLYAAPPAPGSDCNGGNGGKASPASYPDLLLLPSSADSFRYAFVRDQTGNCAPPHIAFTAIQQHGDSVGAGLVVEGPDAATPAEDGREGPGVGFLGDKGHAPIDGQPATEFSLSTINHTDAYWTEPDGGQWHAIVRDMTQADAVGLLNRLSLDPTAGTATLSGAAADGWTVMPPVRDQAADQTGVVMSQWIDPQGHLVDLTVTQTPDRTMQDAVSYGGPESMTTVRQHPAVLVPHGGTSGDMLTWQEAKDVQVQLVVHNPSGDEIVQVADSLQLVSPDDPRFALQGG